MKLDLGKPTDFSFDKIDTVYGICGINTASPDPMTPLMAVLGSMPHKYLILLETRSYKFVYET